MDKTIKKFLEEHGFYLDLDLPALTKAMLSDMRAGLSLKKSDEPMIRTYIDPSQIEIREKSVIVIDAGGTNFRSALVKFSADGSYSLSDFEKTKMPGIERELSKKEFFAQIAKNIERFKDSCEEICFCFSYAMTITEDSDGILDSFSKEVKAPEVVGSKIGAELKIALGDAGWSKIPKVVLLNDTASALLSGTGNKKYSSYIGFILGTGMNAAFVQNADSAFNLSKRQIIVCESAKFSGFKNSDFDIILDEKSVNPGTNPFEKLCSGAYLGPLALETLKFAAKEEIFSPEFSKKILNRENLTLIEVSDFLENSDENGKFSDMFDDEGANESDCENLFAIFDALVARMAQLSAVILASCIIQCGEGKSADSPICVSCNGSSFFKTYKIIERTKKYLADTLNSLTGGKSPHYEILPAEADITRGTAMAAMIQ